MYEQCTLTAVINTNIYRDIQFIIFMFSYGYLEACVIGRIHSIYTGLQGEFGLV